MNTLEMSDDELLAFIERQQKADAIQEGLEHFHGTDNWYRHPLGIRYTDGVKFVAEQGGAYWLIDAIASWQCEPQIKRSRMLQEFQIWELDVNHSPDRKTTSPMAALKCLRDTGDVAFTQFIEYTDFPLDRIRFYLENGVLMLPGER